MPDAGRFSILLAEDNAGDVGLVREALQRHGVEGELVVVSDGEEAVHYIEALDTAIADCPDLALVDLNLPKRSGSEVLRAMRNSTRCRNTKVVILSSSDAEQDKATSQLLGADRYIRKPLRLHEFLSLGAIFKSLLEA